MTLDQYVQEFERKINTAMQERYSSFPEKAKKHIVENSLIVNQLDSYKFIEKYKNSEYFNESQCEKLIHYFLDVKLQAYFIQEFQLGLYNSLIYIAGETPNYKESPYMLLKHLGLDQQTILMSRILWERLMNFVYFLEEGKELKGSGPRKSKKKTFAKFLEKESNKWAFLKDYSDVIDGYDDILRTPETHKSSKLRKFFIEDKPADSEMLLAIINIFSNIWQNIFAILDGDSPNSKHWNSGMGKFGVDAPELH